MYLTLVAGCQNNSTVNEVEFESTLTVDELMHLLIEPAADVLWDSAGSIITFEGEESLVPTTEEGWFAAESAAGILIESGDLLNMPKRSSIYPKQWQDYATNMSNQAKTALEAVLNQDGDLLFQAGADLYQSCLACHDEFWQQESN